MLEWMQLLAARIRNNLASAPISEAQKEDIVAEAVADTEAGRGFGVQEESKPSKQKEDEPLTSRGEKLSDLRKKARAWAGWEPWLGG